MIPARNGNVNHPKKIWGLKKYLGIQRTPMTDSSRMMRKIRPAVCLNISLMSLSFLGLY